MNLVTEIKSSTGMHKDLKNQVEVIAAEIRKHIDAAGEPGLLGGKAGITLFYAYLAKAFPEKEYLQTTFDCLDDLGNILSESELGYSMSGGVAGIAFVFQHLRNIGILDKADDLNLSEIDEFVAQGVEVDAQAHNWDPLHGMTGLGLYFLERHEETGETKYLERIVDHLAAMRIKSGDHWIWITPGYQKYSNDNFNFGTAHGMPGLLCFLARVHTSGIRKPLIEEMMSSSLPWLLLHEQNNAVYCFPTAVDVQPAAEEKPSARLGWCYGDLCMAFALLRCGEATGKKEWINKGIEVALKTTHRTFENAGCTDAPFCHGSAGLVHLYNRLFKHTGEIQFKSAADRWLNLTLEHFYKPGEGAGGYFFRSYNEEKDVFELNAQHSLLEGSAGIALVYLSLFNTIEPGWDKIFFADVAYQK